MSTTELLKTLPALAEDINREHSAAVDAATTAVQHARRCGELLRQAKAQLQHGEWGDWIQANCSFSERTAQAYMRLAKELPKLDDQKRNAVADLSFRDAMRSIAQSTKTLATLPDSQVEFAIQAAADGCTMSRAVVNACRASVHQQQEIIPSRLLPSGDDRGVEVRREEDSTGRAVWSICIGLNVAGLQLSANLDALKAEPEFASRQAEIQSQLERIKALRREADELEAAVRISRRQLGDDLQVEVTLRHGWSYPVTELHSYWVTPEFDAELSTMNPNDALCVLHTRSEAGYPGITGRSNGWNGDVRWMPYVFVPERVREVLSEATVHA